MREFGGSQSRTMARRLVIEWVNQYGRWAADEWHPSIIASRLKSIVMLWGWFGESAALSQQQMMVTSIAVQLDCLKRDWRGLTDTDDRIEALAAIIITGLFSTPTSILAAMPQSSVIIFRGGCWPMAAMSAAGLTDICACSPASLRREQLLPPPRPGGKISPKQRRKH